MGPTTMAVAAPGAFNLNHAVHMVKSVSIPNNSRKMTNLIKEKRPKKVKGQRRIRFSGGTEGF